MTREEMYKESRDKYLKSLPKKERIRLEKQAKKQQELMKNVVKAVEDRIFVNLDCKTCNSKFTDFKQNVNDISIKKMKCPHCGHKMLKMENEKS